MEDKMSKLQYDSKGNLIVPDVPFFGEDNLVFKQNWNDHGWKGICGKKAREYNVSKNRSWCCDPTNKCAEMMKIGEKGFPCMESSLFVDFKLDPGMYLKGEKRGDEKHIHSGMKGKLAFLTTISPEKDEESERYFIGVFDIEKIGNERDVYGNKETSIIISPNIKLKFWNYYKNKDGSIKWGSGLVRYINDEVSLKILYDLKNEFDKIGGFDKEKKNLNMLIERYKGFLA